MLRSYRKLATLPLTQASDEGETEVADVCRCAADAEAGARVGHAAAGRRVVPALRRCRHPAAAARHAHRRRLQRLHPPLLRHARCILLFSDTPGEFIRPHAVLASRID